jgi:hypothetical protein
VEKSKERILDRDFVREAAIVVGVPVGLFVVLVIGYLILDLLV